MRKIASIIAMTLKAADDESVKAKARGMVSELTAQYPLYEQLTY